MINHRLWYKMFSKKKMKQQDGGPDPHLSWPTSFSYNSPGRQMDLGRFTSGINGSFSRSFLQTGSINHQSLVPWQDTAPCWRRKKRWRTDPLKFVLFEWPFSWTSLHQLLSMFTGSLHLNHQLSHPLGMNGIYRTKFPSTCRIATARDESGLDVNDGTVYPTLDTVTCLRWGHLNLVLT